MKIFFLIIITRKGVDFFMLFYKKRSSFGKGIAVGMVAGALVGASTMILFDEDRMRCVRKFAKNGWHAVTKKFR